MLICGLWSTGYLDWYHGPFMFGFPAWCLFHWPDSMSDYEQNYNTLSVGLSVALLSVSYFARGAVISSAASSWLERNLSRMPRVIIERYLRRLHQKIMARSNSQTRLLSVFHYKMLRSLFVLFVVAIDLYSSALWEVDFEFYSPGILLILMDNLVGLCIVLGLRTCLQYSSFRPRCLSRCSGRSDKSSLYCC
jgi:hypothetical protein